MGVGWVEGLGYVYGKGEGREGKGREEIIDPC